MLEYYFFVVAFVLGSVINAQGGVIISEDKNQCAAQMIDWCKGMKYPKDGAGMSMISISYHDSTGYYRIFCSSDAEGTNCTKNKTPWFYCSPDNKFSYKGKVLEDGSTDIDDDMCETANKAFNDIFIQDLNADNSTIKTELEKGMESFFQQMASMQEQIDRMQKMMKGIPLFLRNFWNLLEDNPFERTNTTNSDSTQSEEDVNQLEREW